MGFGKGSRQLLDGGGLLGFQAFHVLLGVVGVGQRGCQLRFSFGQQVWHDAQGPFGLEGFNAILGGVGFGKGSRQLLDGGGLLSFHTLQALTSRKCIGQCSRQLCLTFGQHFGRHRGYPSARRLHFLCLERVDALP